MIEVEERKGIAQFENEEDLEPTEALIAKLCVPIEDTVTEEEIQGFKTMTERYFENKFCISFNTNQRLDTMLRVHTNKTILVGLAEGHDIVKQNKKIKALDFEVGKKNRADIQISGKGKKGAQKLQQNTVLCKVHCEDESVYPIHAGVQGVLVEINEEAIKNPNILVKHYTDLGFLCIIVPSLHKGNVLENTLLNQDQYNLYNKSN